jgi:hypothetical protein
VVFPLPNAPFTQTINAILPTPLPGPRVEPGVSDQHAARPE